MRQTFPSNYYLPVRPDQPTLSSSLGGSFGGNCPVAVFDLPTLGQVLNGYDAAPTAKCKRLEPEIDQEIIRFRSRLARGMDEPEKTKLKARIARYINSLVERRQKYPPNYAVDRRITLLSGTFFAAASYLHCVMTR